MAEQKEPSTPPVTASPRRQRLESNDIPNTPKIPNFSSTSVFYDDDAMPNHAGSFSHNTSFSSPKLTGSAAAAAAAPAANEEMQKELREFLALYQEKMKKWESLCGEWVEVRETLSGNAMWYNSATQRLVFDAPPNTEILSVSSPRSQSHRSEQRTEQQQYYLHRPLSPLPNEDVVASLLQFDLDDWNFDYGNSNVYNYRLSASQRDHGDMLPPPQQYVFPEYFSLAPLPELLANKFLAKIQLPSEYSKNKKYSLVQIKNEVTTASDVIKAGVTKLDPPYNKSENANDFIIKIVGQNAYMYGKKRVIEYEAVRHALRNENDVEFALIKQLNFKEQIESAKQESAQQKAQFKTAYDSILATCQPKKRSTFGRGDGERRDARDLQLQADMDLPATAVDLYEFEWHYRLNIEGLTNVTSLPRYDETLIKSVYVAAELWCGDLKLTTATIRTGCTEPKPNIRWGLWLSSQNLIYSQLPRETILCLIVCGVRTDSTLGTSDNTSSSNIFGSRKYDGVALEDNAAETLCLAWCRLPLICDDNKLRSGQHLLNMWSLPKLKSDNVAANAAKSANDNPFRYRGTTVDRNVKALDSDQCQLLIAFDEHQFDVVAPKYTTVVPSTRNAFGTGGVVGRSHAHAISLTAATASDKLKAMSKKQKQSLDEIILRSPLESLQAFEKQMIWENRETLWHRPEALSAFVQSVNWCNVHDVVEAHKYIDIWAAPRHFEHAMEFLDYKYMDSKLREKAIDWLNEMDDTYLQRYLLQLVQCLKFELHHENALSLFLIRRALRSPYQIGHYLFWHLKSEYDEFIEYHERFGLYIEEYLLFCCTHKHELFVQNAMLKRLEWINKKIVGYPEKKRFGDDIKQFFKQQLHRVNRDLPSSKGIAFGIPLFPRWKALNIKIEACKYMSSKKVPLWLVFENADPLASDIVVMYKCGDDLRQDMLTLQLIELMDAFWLHASLDLHLKPYKCLSTGYQAGMLEIVLNSHTVNSISEKYGGVFNEKTIDSFLKNYNTSPQFLSKAKELFARSCAGYCIATYVLGISDRHSSNYMVCRNGQFFHIDFGHFLGNWKTKWGIKRERTPLVFTNQMKYAIANETDKLFPQFLTWCSSAYLTLRENSRILFVLFRLMIAAGMEELVVVDDILYFQNALNLKYDTKKASKHISKAIDVALNDWGTYVNNKFHQIRHQNKK
mmetsp:Transcript_52561/g.87040  ORF Transcript_52561/g.87040 Transcript_52561/m.87040 type:complete len:1185 (-) Transcript_52561:126-3680(-)|eukprot:CAMPEP_0202689680 /NCGR_PEP_ID=MMETSP1385-20130828/4879_1 /ASSEMBLY_ACC=CAM_ASM_000861 /TAXON_ID=933848 /ORGANISM="Elphidium margaritaceum" /LENGTH=1184 /DNA_ID=CAMNT_0049344847 /DNA_START=23 /DNA_END=3577 /DNA_ORIENTATION=+